MKRSAILAALIGLGLWGGSAAFLAGQTAPSDLEHQLRQQYPLTILDASGSVLHPGVVLEVQMDGITALPLPGEYPCNTYKAPPGQIRASGMCAANYSITRANQVRLMVGGQVYLTKIVFKPTEIVFKLMTVNDSTPHRAALSFQFPKGFQDSMKLKDVQDTISQVLAPSANQNPVNSASPPARPATPAAVSGSPLTLPASYVGAQSPADQLQLNADNSFTSQYGGQSYHGTFTVVRGRLIIFDISELHTRSLTRIEGNKLVGSTVTWVLQDQAASAPAPAGAPVALRFPSTYTSAQSPGDQIQLNADYSFSLQEGGESYHGTFTVQGNTLELNIKESNSKTTATLQGNSLTDSSGQTWTLHDQPAGPPPADSVLQNADIVKMAKAGFDDSIITAKISGSKCQFDTSTDALIQLKQNGVSAGVIKAMVAAGK